MKISKFFALIAFFALAMTFVSCQRDYTCTCTTYDADGNVLGSSTSVITDTRNEAKAACDEGDSNILGVETECELD
ncbi:MAG: hypothetical protein GYB31_11970 [Bacteroidetes bacterium]|nr:hypothetical protein [Bacteroidota bacterium]